MLNKLKIIKSFNASAQHYHSVADIQPRIAQRLAEYLPEMNAENILEIGCGTGLFSHYLQRQFPRAQILLTDMAPSMLEICQKNLAGHPNIQFRQMDGEMLSDTGYFDLIASSMTLHWFSDIKKSLQHIISRLAPGGKLIFAILGENSLQEWRDICSAHHLTTTPEFPCVDYLKSHFPELKTEVEVTQQVYQTTYEFFKTLKLIGAATPHAAHRTLNPGLLRQLMRTLDNKNLHGINITYEVIYGCYEKS
jgi:malonyl-CoA O-methyltransferase